MLKEVIDNSIDEFINWKPETLDSDSCNFKALKLYQSLLSLNKANKNEYKLPGGGLEDNEEEEEAFKREVLEETGCVVEIIKKLGTAEEYKNKINYKQISHVFVGKVIEDTKHLNVTKKEKDEGARLLWETPSKALELITNCYDKLIGSNYESVYVTKFIVLRDHKILEYYINKCM